MRPQGAVSRQVDPRRGAQLGHSHDNDLITYRYHSLADPKDGDICPDDYSTTTTTSLKNADQLMMWNSDNRMTKGVLAKYGKSGVLAYGSSLGLTHTAINHDIGCPTSSTHNRTTLVDLGKVYEAFQHGTITTSTTWKSQFRSRMLNESNYSGFRNALCPVVTQDAVKPESSGRTAPRYFVFGEYVDGTTIDSQSEADAVNAARGKEYQEAMRPYVRAALTTW